MERRNGDFVRLLGGGGGSGTGNGTGNGNGGYLSNYEQYVRRITYNPSEALIQNPNANPPYLETLIPDHQTSLSNAFNRLNLSSNNTNNLVSGYNRHQSSLFDPTNSSLNGVPMLGNPINDSSFFMGHPDFYQPNNPEEIEYQRMLRCHEDYSLASQMAAIRLDYGSLPIFHQQGLEGFGGLRRSSTDSALNNQCWRMSNCGVGGGMMGGCRCGNDWPSSVGNSDHFRIRPCTNASGFRLNSGGLRGRRGLSLDRPIVESDRVDLTRSPSYNRNRLQPQQYTNISLEESKHRILAMAHDQNGCRFLQAFFDDRKLKEMELIITELKGQIGKLMVDPFGNYLVQKILEVCSEEQLTEIIHSVTRVQFELVHISLNSHGTCCVQKLLELLKTPDQISLVMKALGPGAVLLTKDTTGHHVLQLCLKSFTNEDNKELLKSVAENCVDIATNKCGCCILQQCVEHSRGEPRERIVTNISENALLLAQDPYGNYVVQYLLQQRSHRITDDILKRLKGSHVALSMQKFSSNVVQRCINESGKEWSREIIRELIDSPNILMLFQDQFANYVMQAALDASRAWDNVFNALTDLIRIHYQSLRSHPFGKRVISKMNELTRRDRI